MIVKGSNFTCDRCGETAFMPEQDVKSNKWRTVQRYSADDVLMARLLCPGCGAEYGKLAVKQDSQFNDFMNGVSK